MLADYHIHTTLCKHATGEPEEYLAAAVANGLGEICMTDHTPNPDNIGAEFAMGMDEFPKYQELVLRLQAAADISVLFGVEADYYPGCEKHFDAWLTSHDFDLVLGSIHYMQGWGIDNPDEIVAWQTANVPEVWKRYFEMIADMAGTGMYDAASHLDLPKKFGYRPVDAQVREYAAPALDAIAEAGMAIEISTGGLRKPCAEIYPSEMILTMAYEREIPIILGSDSHAPAEVGYEFSQSVALARKVGYTHRAQFRQRRMTPVPLDP